MKAKPNRSGTEPDLQDARTRALLSGNPDKLFGTKAGLDEKLPMTLCDIQDFIRLAYHFDGNPLETLRKYFSGFEWKYHDRDLREKIPEIVSGADYVLLRRPESDYTLGVVTARRKSGGKPKRICYLWFDPAQNDYARDAWPQSLQKSGIAKFVR